MIVTSQNTPSPKNAPEPVDASEQMRIRMEKRAKLLERGTEAYPVGVERTHSLAEIREKYAHLEADDTTGDTVGVTGRVVFIRNTGKLCFATLQEGGTDGKATRLQAMLSLANVGEEALADWKALVDLGDHVFIKGEVISSAAASCPSWRIPGPWPPRPSARCPSCTRTSTRKPASASATLT